MGMIVDFNHGRKWMRMNISNKLFVLAAFAAVISLASVSCEKKGDKAATTADNSPINILYDTPQLWAEPIDDYLKVGNENYPDGFNKNIGTLDVFDNKLWIGYGDMTRNMGSDIPIEFRRFDDPSRPDIVSTPVSAEGQGAKQRTPTDTGEEQSLFPILTSSMYSPLTDPLTSCVPSRSVSPSKQTCAAASSNSARCFPSS